MALIEMAATDGIGLEGLLEQLQEFLPEGVPAWLLVAGLALVVVLLGIAAVRDTLRRLGGRKPAVDWDRDLRIDLDACPLPVRAAAGRLTVYNQPARLRLVVMAPVGRGEVDALAVEKMLEQVVPGLGSAAAQDRPLIRVWPAQVSQQGFAATFHRATTKAAARGEPSRWVLLAGRAQAGRQAVLLGLGLWTDANTTLDRLTLEPRQWLDVLRRTT